MAKLSKHLFIILGIWLTLVQVSSAQHAFENYTRLGPEDGLPDRHIYDLEFDQYGIAWIGAQDGLFTFDGYDVYPFDLEQVDSAFLKGYRIFCILPHGDSLWIGTDLGLTILNLKDFSYSNHYLIPENQQFEPNHDVVHGIRDMMHDRAGNIWLCPSFCGMVKFDITKEQFIHYPLALTNHQDFNYTLLEQTSLDQIIQDNENDSIFWGFGLAGLFRLDMEKKEMNHISYTKGSLDDQYRINRKMSIFQAKDKKIYTGSWEMGLSIYDPDNNTYYAPILEDPSFDKKLKQHLWNISQKNDSILYLTFNEGLFLYNTRTHSFALLKENNLKQLHLQFGVDFVDDAGRIWNRYSRGITIVDPLANQFKWVSLESVNNSANKVLPRKVLENIIPDHVTVVGQFTDGIYHVNLQNGSILEISPDFTTTKDQEINIWGADRMDPEHILLAEGNNIALYNVDKRTFGRFSVQPPMISSYNSIIVDEEKTAWIGTEKNGLYSLSLSDGLLTSWSAELPYPTAYIRLHDSRNQLWISLDQGYAKMNLDDTMITTYDYQRSPDNSLFRVNNFCECPNGEIWMSAGHEGIGMYDSTGAQSNLKKLEVIEYETGLASWIIGVACNSKNQVWAMSATGLYQIDRSGNNHPFFSFDYGVFDAEYLIHFLTNDQLLIGGRDGFYIVDPDQLIKNNELPWPYVVRIDGNKGSVSNYSQLLKSEKVHLAARDNYVHIVFSARNYSLSDQVTFEYRLQGLDENWIPAEDRRSVTYTNLDGGNYYFMVRAANNEGVWNPQPYQLEIEVARPWYKTQLFYFGLLIGLCSIVYLSYRLKINQVRKEEQLRSDYERRLSEVKMNALQAQMNPHFIFNCLNSIDASIIRNDTRKASEYLNDFSRLIRLILQNSRSSYVMLEDDLQALALYVKMEQVRLKNSFEFNLIVSPEVNLDTIEIPPMLLQPYVENAIWHGISPLKNKNGKVSVSIKQERNILICTIQDNGIGREAAQKIKAEKKVKRKSVGLSITKERLDMINKIYGINNEIDLIDLKDKKGNPTGTKVIIKIPL